jgi:hypothetical protein
MEYRKVKKKGGRVVKEGSKKQKKNEGGKATNFKGEGHEIFRPGFSSNSFPQH